ncbi:MAG: hypothetical protein JXN61_00365 [Sedimentisphaerales bacterium]|nr:hypothetical protein [Sedimentisphaerales bacterium]
MLGTSASGNDYPRRRPNVLIISFKGLTPTGRIDSEHLVSTLDVLPTICDYAGVKGPAVMRGRSRREVIERPPAR